MKLSELLKNYEHTVMGKLSDPEIRSIHTRAQEVSPGGVYIAIRGFSADGHDFINEAISRGASAIVTEKEISVPTCTVMVKDSRKAAGFIAAIFYNNPSDHMRMVGITGTNGKTTICYLLENILKHEGFNPGVIGTINSRYMGQVLPSALTTPDVVMLQKTLFDMQKAGVTHVLMEVSSHAIDLHRVNGINFDTGVFTNLTQDHLDYHGTIDKYWSCKKKFFTEILAQGPKKKNATAVINMDNPYGKSLLSELSVKAISTGKDLDASILPSNIVSDINGIRGAIKTPAGNFNFDSKLVGNFNLENILSATGAAVSCGIPPYQIKKGIESFEGTPGRLEQLPQVFNRFAFVDYAHTPDALENVIKTLKSMAPAKVICIFGCGGDRDRSKRPTMGKIAQAYSDIAIITSDNPRTEDPLAIIEHIVQGMDTENLYHFNDDDIKRGVTTKGFLVEPDRKKAINYGVMISRPGDTILIAGKGHETYQIIGRKTIDFDDRTEAYIAMGRLEK